MNALDVYDLLLLNALIFTLLLLSLAYLLLLKHFRKKRDKQRQKMMRQLEPIVEDYIFNKGILPRKLIKGTPLCYEALERTLYQYLELVKDEEHQRLICGFIEHYMSNYYENLLKHHRLAVRLNALYHIEDFHLINFKQQLKDMLEQKKFEDNSEKYQLIKILSKFNCKYLLGKLLTDTSEDILPTFIYKEVLSHYDHSNVLQFVGGFNQLPTPLKKALIEWIGEKHQVALIEFVESKLEDVDLEIRISALKALSQLGYVTDPLKIVAFSNSTIYQERIYFAKIAQTLQLQRYKKVLLQLLTDKNWFVRQAVAEAIATYPDGDIILQYVVETYEDNFAIDVASRWLHTKVGDQTG